MPLLHPLDYLLWALENFSPPNVYFIRARFGDTAVQAYGPQSRAGDFVYNISKNTTKEKLNLRCRKNYLSFKYTAKTFIGTKSGICHISSNKIYHTSIGSLHDLSHPRKTVSLHHVASIWSHQQRFWQDVLTLSMRWRTCPIWLDVSSTTLEQPL